MAVELTLDARLMEPPEPFDKALEILQKLQPGEYLCMLHRRIPYPLFEFCNALSLEHSVKEMPAGDFEILIYQGCDRETLYAEGILCA